MARKPRITVVGSFAVGMTIRAPRLPVFGETILGTDFDMGPGGKGSNQAVAAARLEAESSLLAILGTDRLAEIANNLYAAEGVDTSLVATSVEKPTGVGFIILNERGENFILLEMGANQLMDAAMVDRGETRIAQSDVVMTVLEIPTAAAARAMELGRRHQVTTILNPAPARPLSDELLALADYVTPNESELRILLGRPPDDRSSTESLAAELRLRGARNVVVTMGDKGALVVTETAETRVPAMQVDVTDTTGAGDAFNAGFAVALAEGRDVVDATRFGVICGGLACTRLGVIPSLPSRKSAVAMFEGASNADRRIRP
jgi:ribokinase